ncbi:MAG: hypothetical protein KC649_08225, partial [Candidatus Omnitrophica bacterium]|nr:hypothetical protein [Candidatus Omnitrophota bacterium]
MNDSISNTDEFEAVLSASFDAQGQQIDTTILVNAYLQVGKTFEAYQDILNASEKASADWVLNALARPRGFNVNLSNGLQQNAAEQDVEGLLAIGMTPEGLVVFSLAREQLATDGRGLENDIAAVQVLAQRVFDLNAGFSAADRSSLAAQFSIPVNQQVLTNKAYVKVLLQAATNSGGGGAVFFSGSSLTFGPGTAAGGVGFGSSSAGYGGSGPAKFFPNNRPEIQIYRPIDRLQGLIREGDLEWNIIREQPNGPNGKTIYRLQIQKDSILGDVIIAESADDLLFDATINTVEHYFITVLRVTKDGQ